jgi:hypothetical protein
MVFVSYTPFFDEEKLKILEDVFRRPFVTKKGDIEK